VCCRIVFGTHSTFESVISPQVNKNRCTNRSTKDITSDAQEFLDCFCPASDIRGHIEEAEGHKLKEVDIHSEGRANRCTWEESQFHELDGDWATVTSKESRVFKA
jgi:hypothetical protein